MNTKFKIGDVVQYYSWFRRITFVGKILGKVQPNLAVQKQFLIVTKLNGLAIVIMIVQHCFHVYGCPAK